MQRLLSLTQIVNLKSLFIAALALVSTWVCLRFGIVADFPLTLIATAIVFPLVFSISTAYARREKALEEYGSLKAHGRSLYLASRYWVSETSARRDAELKDALRELLAATRDMLTNPVSEMSRHEPRVYAAFGLLSEFVRDMRQAHLSASEASPLHQAIARMLVAFENLKHIFEYRTPRTLRAFSDFFILLLPILYGPFFAYQAAQFDRSLFFIMPILFALILVGLANIQDHLENPFDQIGADDVAIDPDRFVASLEPGLTSAGASLGTADGQTQVDHSRLQAPEAAAVR
jgi:predicted membrane chloride channel (bestrophin family)